MTSELWKDAVLHTVWEVWGKAKADCEGDYSDERLIKVFRNTMLPDKLIPIAICLRNAGWLDKDEPPDEKDIWIGDDQWKIKSMRSSIVHDEIDRAVSE